MTPMRFDLGLARAILGAVDPGSAPVAFRRLHGGSAEVWRVDLAPPAAPLVVKIYGEEPAWNPAKEALVAGWIGAALPVPIPHWLAVDESRALLPLRYAVMSLLPGEPLRGFIATPGAADAYRRMGALLRHIHTIPMASYGYIVGDGVFRPKDANADYMQEAFARAFRQFRDRGGDADLSGRLESKALARFDLLAASAGPVLCHDDFQQGNVLVERAATGELTLTGLVDFGNTLAGDALADLAKALFCCAHEDPSCREALLAGYGQIDHPDVAGALWLYTLYHRLTMWAWLTRFGDSPAAPGPAGLMTDLAAMG